MAQQNPFCEAQRDLFNGLVFCHVCNMLWDDSDPFPPRCQLEAALKKEEN